MTNRNQANTWTTEEEDELAYMVFEAMKQGKPQADGIRKYVEKSNGKRNLPAVAFRWNQSARPRYQKEFDRLNEAIRTNTLHLILEEEQKQTQQSKVAVVTVEPVTKTIETAEEVQNQAEFASVEEVEEPLTSLHLRRNEETNEITSTIKYKEESQTEPELTQESKRVELLIPATTPTADEVFDADKVLEALKTKLSSVSALETKVEVLEALLRERDDEIAQMKATNDRFMSILRMAGEELLK